MQSLRADHVVASARIAAQRSSCCSSQATFPGNALGVPSLCPAHTGLVRDERSARTLRDTYKEIS